MFSIKRLCDCAPFRGIEIEISFENNLCLLFSSAQLYFSQTKGKSLDDCSECLFITSGCQSEHSIASAFLKRTTRYPVCDPVLFVNSDTQQCSRTFLRTVRRSLKLFGILVLNELATMYIFRLG